MVRKTAVQRQEEALLAEAKEAEARAAYRLLAPEKLLRLMASTNSVDNASFEIRTPDDTQLFVTFKIQGYGGDRHERACNSEEYKLDFDSEEWQFDEVENAFERQRRAAAERERVRQVAIDAYNSLTPEQRTALNLAKPF